MRKTFILSVLIWLILPFTPLRSQIQLGLSPGNFNPNVQINNLESFEYVITNLDTQNTFTGYFGLDIAVDTVGAGNYTVIASDSIPFMLFQPLASHVDSTPILVGSQFKQGINIVVIWPKNSVQNPQVFSCLDTLKYYVLVTGYAGVSDIHQVSKEQLVLFPNPFSTRIYLKVANPDFNLERVSLFDMIGQNIMDVPFKDGSIDLQGVQAGAYMLELADKTGTVLRYKVIKE